MKLMGTYIKQLLVGIMLVVSATSFAQQNETLSIDFTNSTIKEALLQLEEKTDYTFYFQDNWFDGVKRTKTYKDTKIETLLKDLLSETSLNFSIINHKIVLTKNSIIVEQLPINFFEKRKEDLKESTAPIFQKEYISNQDSEGGALITIGKENENGLQNTFTVGGYIFDAVTKQPVEGVEIYSSYNNKKTHTNSKGYFTLKTSSGLNVIKTKVPGYDDVQKNVVVFGNGTLNLEVTESIEQLGEVVIKSNKDDNIRKAVVGLTKVDVTGAKNIPMVLGEKDLLKIATTMPGVKTAGEGSLGFNVRGGKSDQNLILFDNAVMYNPSHFFGVFSAINPFSTGDVSIYKGSIPSEFGGRLSSVIDISSKEVEKTKFSGQGNIGPVTGNLTLEVPIVKEKAGVLIGARSTYSDWILKQIPKESIKNSEASFLDGIVRFDSKINDKNQINATAYYSNDQFSISSDSLYKYSNALASLEWNHTFNKKNKSNLQFNNSRYKFNIINDGIYNTNFDLNYTINESQLKLKLKYIPSKNHTFDYGVSGKYYTIDPGNLSPLGSESIIQSRVIERENALESAVYVSDKFKVNDKLMLDLGLRYSFYAFLGEGTQNVYATDVPISTESVVETVSYGKNEVIQTYAAPEVRASLRYFLSPSLSFKAGYNKTIQYVHMLSGNTTASPVDTWKLSNLNIAPQKSDQYSVGLFKNSKDNDYEISLEGYYKEMKDILDFKVGAELILNENIETEVLSGVGKAYGVEFLLRKKTGRLNGWLGYTYSKSLLQLESNFLTNEINNGEFFPANYDKPHDLSLIANYKLTKRFSFSFNFLYQTGRPITYPIGKYEYAGVQHVLYSDRNQFRIPDYYRLDVGVNIEGNHKIKKLAHSFWNISVYNALGKNNPYSIFFVSEEGTIKAYKTSIFSIPIPTISYNFKF